MALAFPWFLVGLLATAVPIVLHFFELRRPRRIAFTNVEFIREVKLVTARQRNLKHKLILLARLGFVVFLVLAFVQPYLAAPTVGEHAGAVHVWLDTTPSMQAGEANEASAFELAVSQARELAGVYSASTQFLVNSESRKMLTASTYRAAIDKLSVSGMSGPLDLQTLEAVGGKREKQIYLFSDFQKNAFSPRVLQQFPATQQVFCVPVGKVATRNVFVDSVWLDDAFVRRNADIQLRVRLRNGGNAVVEGCQIKLFVGDQQVAVYQTAVPTDKAVVNTVRLRLESEQLQRCRVVVEDFPVTFDNTYYFTLQASPQIKVVDVAEAATAEQLYANEPLFTYARSIPGKLNYRALETADMVLVQEQARIDASLRENLRGVLARGGTVVLVPAVAADHESYNQLFRELGVGTVQWEPADNRPVWQDVSVPNTQNPFFRDVFAMQNRPAVMPKAAPVLRWSRSNAEVLRFRDGAGYLGGFASGQGTVYVFAAPFDGRYSDFTRHALFVPVMYRLALQSFRNNLRPAYRLNQGTVALNVTAAAGVEQVYKLEKDSASFIPAQRMQAGMLRFDVPPAMRKPGFYTLVRAGQPVTTLAFNYDKRESVLASYTPDELRQLIGPNRPNIQVYDVQAGQSVAARYQAERVGRPLWPYCVAVALACLLAEVLLLRFMGRSTVAREPIARAA